jgi:hypothetical protein
LLKHSAPCNASKTLDKKTVQNNVDDDILTKQIYPRAQRAQAEDWKLV